MSIANGGDLPSEWSSSVSTSSLLCSDDAEANDQACRSDDDIDSVESCPAEDAAPSSTRNAHRQLIRDRRREGSLTALTLEDLCVYSTLGTPPSYIVPDAVYCVRGSFSQFMQSSQSKGLLPPLAHDCCQTFSTLAAILLSSFGFVVLLEECWNVTSVNYLVYLSAWLHQLTFPLWPRTRPTINDLNQSLVLQEHFPSKIEGSEFIVVFYDEQVRARELVSKMCCRRAVGSESAICGYVIVSGQYTVSIFSLLHDVAAQSAEGLAFSAAWCLYIADSHGTLPWAQGKASVSCLSLGVQKPIDVDSSESRGYPKPNRRIFSFEEGIEHYCSILFALLEDHRKLRKSELAPQVVPYMTWTPIRRKHGVACTAKELTALIDTKWLQHVLQNPVIAEERKKFGLEHPKRCFWGQLTKHPVTNNLETKPVPCSSPKDAGSSVTSPPPVAPFALPSVQRTLFDYIKPSSARNALRGRGVPKVASVVEAPIEVCASTVPYVASTPHSSTAENAEECVEDSDVQRSDSASYDDTEVLATLVPSSKRRRLYYEL